MCFDHLSSDKRSSLIKHRMKRNFKFVYIQCVLPSLFKAYCFEFILRDSALLWTPVGKKSSATGLIVKNFLSVSQIIKKLLSSSYSFHFYHLYFNYITKKAFSSQNMTKPNGFSPSFFFHSQFWVGLINSRSATTWTGLSNDGKVFLNPLFLGVDIAVLCVVFITFFGFLRKC